MAVDSQRWPRRSGPTTQRASFASRIHPRSSVSTPRKSGPGWPTRLSRRRRTRGSRDRRTSADGPVQLMTAPRRRRSDNVTSTPRQVLLADWTPPGTIVSCPVSRTTSTRSAATAASWGAAPPSGVEHGGEVGSVRQSPTRPIARRYGGAGHRRPDTSRRSRRRSSGPRRPASAPWSGSVGQRAAKSGPPDQRRKRRATPRRRAAIWFRRSTVENTGVDAGRCVRASAASTTVVLGIDACFGRT